MIVHLHLMHTTVPNCAMSGIPVVISTLFLTRASCRQNTGPLGFFYIQSKVFNVI